MKMKKIILGLAVSATMLTTSCDMDTTNYGIIDQGNAIESVDDCHSFVNGIYTYLRAKGSGTWLNNQDIQMDQFVGLVDNGNRHGLMSDGTFTASDQDLTNLFYNLYIQVKAANYFVPKADALLENPAISDTDKARIKYYKATAMFARAYAYWYLFDKYVDYKESDLDAPAKGLPIELTYNPSGDRSTYVGRSTIRETVTYINGQLKDAYDLMTEYETNVSAANCNPNAIYVSSYAIAALQARFALLTEDYATALDKAELVINSDKYELCDIDAYADMWVNDESSELILVGSAQRGEGGVDVGTAYYTNNRKETSDYIPTFDVLMSYDDGDCRFDAFFELYDMVVGGNNYYAFAFTKFPGNPALDTNTGVNSCLQKAKLFRLSEMYLVAAEAAAMPGTQKNETKANSYLNDLRTKRIQGYEAVTYSGNALINAIRAERGKELIGEGFRLSDIRRWGNGFTREAGFENFAGTSLAPLADIMEVVLNKTNNVSYQAGDYRLIWPIPTREMQINPQLAGQQNPRY